MVKRMRDFNELNDKLTMSFMWYQERLEHPMSTMSEDQLMLRYRSDDAFRRKVRSMTGHVMSIVVDHCNPKEKPQ